MDRKRVAEPPPSDAPHLTATVPKGTRARQFDGANPAGLRRIRCCLNAPPPSISALRSHDGRGLEDRPDLTDRRAVPRDRTLDCHRLAGSDDLSRRPVELDSGPIEYPAFRIQDLEPASVGRLEV